jgi:hypothetical protein
MRKVLIATTLFFGTVIGLGLATEPDGTPTRTGPNSASGAYSHEVLQRDAEMTQRMSTPNADGPMQRGTVRDAQLEHSQEDPAFVGALEQHQADIDRMLGRPGGR